MGSSITGVPTTRVSDSFVRERMLTQVQYDQAEMFRLQTQLSTGQRFSVPSEDPVAALRVMSLQSLMERKDQVKSNLTTNASYLSATDSALGNVASLLSSARATALGVLGTTSTDTQRNAAAQQVQQALQQLMDTANQKFRGRYLFTGSDTAVQPFQTKDGYVQYSGNEGQVAAYGDVNLLFDTNITGSEAFGAISQQVRGLDLKPVLSYDARLADLRGGEGISRGSLAISDGHSISTVDISGAETLGDVARLIRAHPPANRALDVEVTATGMTIRLVPAPAAGFDPAADNLTVTEISGGTTANELGILRPNGVGQGPLVGGPLDPTLRSTTSLGDVLGTRSTAYLHFGGADSDLILEANTRGTNAADGQLLNGCTVNFANDAPAAGQETVDYTPGDSTTAGSLTVHIKLGQSRAWQVRDAINSAGLPFAAKLDPLNRTTGGQGTVDKLITAQTSGGSGVEFDQTSGLQIFNQGKTYTIDLSKAHTIEDALNTLNGAGAGVLAEINEAKTGLNLRSRISGADFSIGENGGATATQLGLRSFTDQTLLSSLNHGQGVADSDLTGGHAGADFTITTSDGTAIDVDIAGTRTIGDIRDLINNLGGGKVHAELAPEGNGLQLVDDTAQSGPIIVTRAVGSQAAVELGLIPAGQQSASSASSKTAASGQVSWSQANSDLLIQARDPGTYGNVQVVFVESDTLAKGSETAHYDPDAKTLTFTVAKGLSDANDVLAAMASDPAADAAFNASLDTSRDPTNDGSGVVQAGTFSMTGGTAQTLAGRDVNPQETNSVFNALLRLQHALEHNDNAEAQRAVDLLDQTVLNMNFTRAELGARQQGLDVMQSRLDDEQVELKSVMSTEFDADFAQVVSELTARQIAYEASLRAAGQISKFSLLNYL